MSAGTLMLKQSFRNFTFLEFCFNDYTNVKIQASTIVRVSDFLTTKSGTNTTAFSTLKKVIGIHIAPVWGQQHAAFYWSDDDGATFTGITTQTYFTLVSVSGNAVTFKNSPNAGASCTVRIMLQ